MWKGNTMNAMEMVLSNSGDKLGAFIKGLMTNKPKLSELSGLLSEYSSAFGDVDFETFLDAVTAQAIPEVPAEDVQSIGGQKQAHETRLAIIRLLSQAGEKGVHFRDIVLSCSKSLCEQSIRYHINVLLKMDLIKRVNHGVYAVKSPPVAA